MFRRLPCTERQFRTSPFQDCVWLGDICGIAFSIPQIFAILKMKFSIAFSASRGWDDWVAANCFALFRKFFTEIPAYPFSIYIYIYISLINLGSLLINFTIFTSFFSIIAQLLALIAVVDLHHDFHFPGKHSHISSVLVLSSSISRYSLLSSLLLLSYSLRFPSLFCIMICK